jgi:hypothetical protein
MREMNKEKYGLRFQQVLKELFPLPLSSPQLQAKLCMTPFVLFCNFRYLRTNRYKAGVGTLVKSIVTVVGSNHVLKSQLHLIIKNYIDGY